MCESFFIQETTMKFIFYSILIACQINVLAQQEIPGIDYRTCSTADRYNEIINKNPIIKQLMNQQNQFAEEWTKKNYGKTKINASGKRVISYIIPVVWHVIHNDGPENISKATIEDEIAQLNEDFQKLNANISGVHPLFEGITADCEIEFRLARKDPNGNCTEGITRTKSTLTYAMDEIVKETIRPSWNTPTVKYLNIWQGTKIAFDAGGYAFYPGTTTDETEGIVLIAQQLGNTVTHEVGHYLNLAHLWGDSNDPQDPNNCFDDDQVFDTPNTVGRTGCLPTAESCGSIDNVQNYMEYNFCDLMFTEGQKQRMHAALNSPIGARDLLCSQANLINTGTADPYDYNPICTPIANFNYNKTFICEGQQVAFTDNSYNATPTGWNWTFVGGTPNNSNVQNPIITYNTPGVYSVTHEPFTTNGSGFHQKNDIIIVSSLTADYILPYTEGFENTSAFSTNWYSFGTALNKWELTNSTAYSGNNCVKIENINNNSATVTELVSSTFDLTAIPNPSLVWKSAYAKKVSGNSNDQLIVYSSTDCGASWQIVGIKTVNNLSSAPATNNSFFPSDTTQWKEHKLVFNSTLASSNNVKLKFYFKSNGGNNFYIDDINLVTNITTSLSEINPLESISIFPNPTNKENTTITYLLSNPVKSLRVVLKDVLGNDVANIINNQSFSAGKYTLTLDKDKKLAAGMYFIEFNADNNIKVEKLIVK